jgi:hypothetical protein
MRIDSYAHVDGKELDAGAGEPRTPKPGDGC